jgi:hypothetical protein
MTIRSPAFHVRQQVDPTLDGRLDEHRRTYIAQILDPLEDSWRISVYAGAGAPTTGAGGGVLSRRSNRCDLPE